MKITQAFVRDVKKHLKKDWHDQKWWDFDQLPETQAVVYALNETEPQDPLDSVVRKAEKYFDHII